MSVVTTAYPQLDKVESVDMINGLVDQSILSKMLEFMQNGINALKSKEPTPYARVEVHRDIPVLIFPIDGLTYNNVFKDKPLEFHILSDMYRAKGWGAMGFYPISMSSNFEIHLPKS